MKLVSKFALAFALGSIAIAPTAHAQKKKDKKEQAQATSTQPKLSAGFTKAYNVAVGKFTQATPDLEGAKADWPAAKAAIENDDDKYQAGIFAVQLSAKLKDKALEQEGYALLLASSYTPAETKNSIRFQDAAASYDSRDWPNAETKLIEAYNAGYRKSNIERLIGTSLNQQGKNAEALIWVQRGIDAAKASGAAIDPDDYRRGANYAIKLNDDAAVNKWMKLLVSASPTASNWRDMMNLYMRTAKLDEAETLDVMRLLRLNKALKYPVEYRIYLEAIGAIRYPVEALAVLDEGIAAGHIERSDTAIDDFYKTASNSVDEDIKSLPATEAPARASSSGNVITLTADAFMSHAKYETAQSLYELALSKGAIRDKDGNDRTGRTQMRLAMAKIAQNDLEGAKADLSQITDSKRKEIAEYWIMYIDQEMAKEAV